MTGSASGLNSSRFMEACARAHCSAGDAAFAAQLRSGIV